jgi:hypothetical protein
MYTIGTSALKYIASQIPDPLIQAALKDKITAFVGTAGERDGDGTALHPETLISPYSVYFEVPYQTLPSVDIYNMAWPITTAQLYIPNDHIPMPDAWVMVGAPFDQAFVTPNLLPSGGLSAVLYAFARGNEGDIASSPIADGVPFFARDTESLWIYDRMQGRWVKVAQSSIVPIGGMVAWPEALDVYNPIPTGYIRADGTLRPQAGAFASLYGVVKDSYENPLAPSPVGQFRLPLYNGMIVRYVL